LIIDAKKVSNVYDNIKGNGMMIKNVLEIARNTISPVILQMRLGISALYGRMRTALSSKIQGLKDFMSDRLM
jgi:hypothetical protein